MGISAPIAFDVCLREMAMRLFVAYRTVAFCRRDQAAVGVAFGLLL